MVKSEPQPNKAFKLLCFSPQIVFKSYKLSVSIEYILCGFEQDPL